MQGDNVQPVIEVPAETAQPDPLRQIFIGGGENPDIYGNRIYRADADDLLFLEDSEELGLEGRADGLNFVQEQGPLVGALKQAGPPAFFAPVNAPSS